MREAAASLLQEQAPRKEDRHEVLSSRENALDYAQQRAHSGLCDIQVLNDSWNVVKTITNENLKPVL